VQQTAQVAIGAHVVEPVVVHADVRDVGCHQLERSLATDAEHLLVAGRVELQDGCAELETLRPFGPSAGSVTAFDGENRGAIGVFPARLQGGDFRRGILENALRVLGQRLRGERGVGFDHKNIVRAGAAGNRRPHR
jgi:hypothetical protein